MSNVLTDHTIKTLLVAVGADPAIEPADFDASFEDLDLDSLARAEFAARVRDLSEVLVELGPVAPRHPLPVTVAYHDACHLAHAQGIRAQPRQLLRAIPELDLREIADPEICCGSAGIWNLLNPQPARELGERKARDVLATGARLLVTANPGCLMQVASALRRTGGTIGLAHTAQVLDASIRGLPVARLVPASSSPTPEASR